MVTVSTLIPTYNRADYLPGAIKTALNQTYNDLEIIVVDDCSNDQTPSVLKEYETHSRVRTARNVQNKGIAASYNRAAEIADGAYLCILDDDDRWHPTKVEKQVDALESASKDCAAIYTGGVDRKDGKVIHRYIPQLRGDIYPQVLRQFELNPHSGHMIRSTHFQSVGGFDTTFPRGVDWDLSIRLAKKYKYEYVNEILVQRRLHEDNVSEDDNRIDVGSMISDKYSDELQQYPEIRKVFYSNWAERRAWRALERGNKHGAVYELVDAFKNNPNLYHILLAALIFCGGKRAYEFLQQIKWNATNYKHISSSHNSHITDAEEINRGYH